MKDVKRSRASHLRLESPAFAQGGNVTTPVPDRSDFLSADGHTIYWELFGSGSGEIVCLLNGLAMQTSAWYGFLPRLRPDYDVLLWDYPGQGRSTTADAPYLIDRIASYLVLILERIGARARRSSRRPVRVSRPCAATSTIDTRIDERR